MRPPLLVAVLAACASCRGSSSTPSVDTSAFAAPSPSSAPEAGAPPAEDGGAPARPEDPGPPAIQTIGRFDVSDPAGPRCAWPGCRIVARFSGTREVSVRLREIEDAWMSAGPSEWDVSLDGAVLPKIVTAVGDHDYAIAGDLTPGAHVVELYKRSEAQAGSTQLLALDLHGGVLEPPPPRSHRRVEIVGDSAAAGFGVEGVGLGPDCPGLDYAASYEDFRKSFGARLGEILGAEIFGTVYSGKGMVKNIWRDDDETMPLLFERTLPTEPTSRWDFSRWTPDVVVVMMGGNDFAVGQPYDDGPASQRDFEATYGVFVDRLREVYPAADLWLTASASLSDDMPPGRATRTNVVLTIEHVAAARAAKGDLRVHAHAVAPATPDQLTACNGHATPELHDRIAVELAAKIRPSVGWSSGR